MPTCPPTHPSPHVVTSSQESAADRPDPPLLLSQEQLESHAAALAALHQLRPIRRAAAR